MSTKALVAVLAGFVVVVVVGFVVGALWVNFQVARAMWGPRA